MKIKDEMEEMKSSLVKLNNFWFDKVERNLMTIDDSFCPRDLQMIDRKRSRFSSMQTVAERNNPPDLLPDFNIPDFRLIPGWN